MRRKITPLPERCRSSVTALKPVTMTILRIPACRKVATTRWAMEMEPMLSMGLKSPIREDIPAATISAAVCMAAPPVIFMITLYRIVVEL